MTVVPKITFTPELLVEAPRRSIATPNGNGTLALFTVSTYSLDSHSETKEIRLLNISDGSSTLFSNNPADKDPHWLGDEDEVLWLREGKDGETQIWIGSVGKEKNAYIAGTVPADINNVQTRSLESGDVAFIFGAATTSKGGLLNIKKSPKPLHSAREYTSAPVKFWDTWMPAYKSSLFYTVFKQTNISRGKKWKVSHYIVNALKGTELRFPFLPSGISTEGGTYDISPTGILLQTIKPGQNLSQSSNSGIYYIPAKTFQEKEPALPQKIDVQAYPGSQYSPAFSPDGTKAAFVVNEDPNNEMSSPLGIAILQISTEESKASVSTVFTFHNAETKVRTWDRRPDSFLWHNDSETLFIAAQDSGHSRIFRYPTKINSRTVPHGKSAVTVAEAPIRLTTEGSVLSMHNLNRKIRDWDNLFVSLSGILESSSYARLLVHLHQIIPISSATQGGTLLGFGPNQLESFNFRGAGDYDLQSWIVRPSHFDRSKKYPLALIIHGGPQSAWNDSWTTRWNFAVFAEQGYVVVAPNPTGSTGFGDDLLAAVDGDWGGRPYEDIVKCFEHVEKNFSYVDTENAVTLGASYGGYMVNWIAGQPLARKLKAIVSHDGIFTMEGEAASDYIAGWDKEVGGTLWDRKDLWEKWSPASYVKNWDTPMLVIHSDNDFRCPISEGLAVFNICQAKGIESRFLNFPDENHFVLGRENSLKWHHTVLGWINKFTGVKGGVTLDEVDTEEEGKQDR